MTTQNSDENMPEGSTVGKGFARTETCHIASENWGLPFRGFGNTDFGEQDKVMQKDDSKMDSSTEGMGFARTDKCKIVPDDFACPHRGFGMTDFGEKNHH